MSYYLMQHPQVFMPENLEPYYFARLDVPQNYIREIISDEKKYLSLFKNAKNCKAVGESSPVYLYCPHSALEIKNRFPNSKLIISLRNPIEIAYSEYFSLKFMGFDQNRSFDALLASSEAQLTQNKFHIDILLDNMLPISAINEIDDSKGSMIDDLPLGKRFIMFNHLGLSLTYPLN